MGVLLLIFLATAGTLILLEEVYLWWLRASKVARTSALWLLALLLYLAYAIVFNSWR